MRAAARGRRGACAGSPCGRTPDRGVGRRSVGVLISIGDLPALLRRPCPSVSPGRKSSHGQAGTRHRPPRAWSFSGWPHTQFMPLPPGESPATSLPNGFGRSAIPAAVGKPRRSAIPICSGWRRGRRRGASGLRRCPTCRANASVSPGALGAILRIHAVRCPALSLLTMTVQNHVEGGARVLMDKRSFLERARQTADIGTGKE